MIALLPMVEGTLVGLLLYPFNMAEILLEPRGRTKRVLETYGPNCVYCSRELTQEATIDHVRCISKGGSNWIGNLLPACRRCNTSRGDRSVQEYLSICISEDKRPRTGQIQQAMTRLGDPRSRKGYWLSTLYPEQSERLQLLDRHKDQQLVGQAVGEMLFGEKRFSLRGALFKAIKIELGDNYRRR